MLVQQFIRGLNDCISSDVQVFEPKIMEIVVEKARLVEGKLLAGGLEIGRSVSTLVVGEDARGTQT